MGKLLDGSQEIAGTFGVADQVGITDEHWARFRSDRGFADRVASFMRDGAFIDHDLGTRSYGNYAPYLRVFGPHEWQAFFGVDLTPEQWEVANNFPWSLDLELQCPFWPRQDMGLQVMHTHFAFLGLSSIRASGEGMGIGMLRLGRSMHELTQEWASWRNRPRILENEWTRESMTSYEDRQTQRHTSVQTRWYLMPLSGVNRTALTDDYEVPSAVEWVLGKILYYQKYGRFPGMDDRVEASMVVCADEVATAVGDNLVVELNSARDQLSVTSTNYQHSTKWRSIPVAASRKPPAS